MEISLVQKSDSDYVQSKTYQELDLTKRYPSYDEDTVCRTCTLSGSRDWQYHMLRSQGKIELGEPSSDYRCSPDKEHGSFRIVGTANWKEQRVGIRQTSPYKTVAVVSNCGHQIAPKCKGCDRFAPEQVAIPYDPGGKGIFHGTQVQGESIVPMIYTGSGLPVKYWNNTVGGHCTIPAKGIVKDGKTVFCDPTPRKINVEAPSCQNCNWLDYMGSQWQTDYLEVNDHASVTSWERAAITSEAESTNTPYGVVYNRFLESKSVGNLGRRVWFTARVLKKDFHQGEVKYKVQIEDNNVVAVIAANDERFYVHEDHIPMGYNVDTWTGYQVDPLVGLEVAYPHNKLLKLTLSRLIRYRIWPDIPRREEVPLKEEVLSRRNENCADCAKLRKNKPCYYHAKAPSRSVESRDISFEDPGVNLAEYSLANHAQMKIEERNGVPVAVDLNGNLPEPYSTTSANASVFRLSLSALLTRAKYDYGIAGVKAIMKQYSMVVGGLIINNKMRIAHTSWLHNTSIEPSKPVCSHPNGLNLREVFGDTFGLERTDIDFDMGAMNTMEVEEELRVGWRQHEMTPQRLQEEILSTHTSHLRYNRETGDIDTIEIATPDHYTITKIEGLGGMVREDGTPITDPNEFLERLDDRIAVGSMGEMERLISRRQQLFGYDMSRGYYGRRINDKTSMGSTDGEMVIFNRDSESVVEDIHNAWMCPECDSHYDQSQIADFFNPLCEDCGASLWRNHKTREVMNPRASGGLGNAIVKESATILQRKRLQATLCPNWVLKGAIHIGLDQVTGPMSEVPVGIGKDAKQAKSNLTIHKIAVLDANHRANNAAYYAEVTKVEQLRADYLDENPDTHISELIKLFPTPGGIVYQEKAAGSLSKMGSV